MNEPLDKNLLQEQKVVKCPSNMTKNDNRILKIEENIWVSEEETKLKLGSMTEGPSVVEYIQEKRPREI